MIFKNDDGIKCQSNQKLYEPYKIQSIDAFLTGYAVRHLLRNVCHTLSPWLTSGWCLRTRKNQFSLFFISYNSDNRLSDTPMPNKFLHPNKTTITIHKLPSLPNHFPILHFLMSNHLSIRQILSTVPTQLLLRRCLLNTPVGVGLLIKPFPSTIGFQWFHGAYFWTIPNNNKRFKTIVWTIPSNFSASVWQESSSSNTFNFSSSNCFSA